MSLSLSNDYVLRSERIVACWRQNHGNQVDKTKPQVNQLEHVKDNRLAVCPIVSSQEECDAFNTLGPSKFFDYLQDRGVSVTDVGQLKRSIELDAGSLVLIPTSRVIPVRALLARITGSVRAGIVPGLYEKKNAEGKRILTTTDATCGGTPFWGLMREVQVIKELTDSVVKSWAAKTGGVVEGSKAWNTLAPRISFTMCKQNIYVCGLAAAAAAAPVVAEVPAVAPALPADEEESRLCEEEQKYFGSIRLGGRLERVRAVREARREVRESLSI